MKENFNKLTVKFQEDQQFAEKLLNVETPVEAQAFLKGEGLDMSMEEILEFREDLIKINAINERGELSEEDLEGVAGGNLLHNPMMPKRYKDYPWQLYPAKAYTDTASVVGNTMYAITHPRIRVPRRW